MQKHQYVIPSIYDCLFDSLEEKIFAEYLANYLLFDIKPKTTPNLWQDAEIFIRYKKRDVWSIDNEQRENAKSAILLYQIKYIVNHLKKSDILSILNKFFKQKADGHQPVTKLFEQKLHTTLDALFLTQEKITITKDKAENFDKIFEYPCWVDFTDDANQIIFKKILKNELADEQIDYFLGANDTFHDYDQWFKVAKHILATTNDAHVFWVAGDILSIIWRAIPEDKKSEKWFKDQVFEIFWPRVNSIWPIQNEHKIDFDQDAETKILEDSINWLHTLDDLKERLPELGDYEAYSHNTDEATFTYNQGALLELLNSNPTDIDRILNLFFTMSDSASTEKNVKTLQEIANEKLLPLINANQDEYTNKIVKLTHDAIKHAKDYLASLTRERQNLAKLIK